MSGMIAAIPIPAGVIAPERLIPTVTSSASIRSVKRWHPSRKRAALYALKVLSIRSTIEIFASMAGGSIGWPCRNRLLLFIPLTFYPHILSPAADYADSTGTFRGVDEEPGRELICGNGKRSTYRIPAESIATGEARRMVVL